MQQAVFQKLDALLHVVTDLSTWVAAFEERQDQGEAAVMVSPPSPHRRRARCQATPAPYDEIAPEVCRCMAERMRRATPLNPDTEDEEEHLPHRRGNYPKSGIQRTGASTVIHNVNWPHEWSIPRRENLPATMTYPYLSSSWSLMRGQSSN